MLRSLSIKVRPNEDSKRENQSAVNSGQQERQIRKEKWVSVTVSDVDRSDGDSKEKIRQ